MSEANATDENLRKHLEFIQNIMSRMAQCSFMIKGWSVTIIAAMFALAAAQSNQRFAALAFFPTLMFGALDGYYLCQERLFRHLYDERLLGRVDGFSLKIKKEYRVGERTWFGSVISRTIAPFYGILFGCVIFAICYLKT